ncbi:hypothetical protein AB0E96_23055 [Kitasatospora sp. NPDC036755]|uniref:hypothetical protein n=1 Tax=Kitasatospora sp. NPDC036755 TaxID=3154600 RepID=UPI0033F48E69
MSVPAAFHSVVPDVRRHGHGLRTACARVLDRLAASPLDNTVLGAIGAPLPAARPVPRPDGLRARWHPAPRPDGTSALEATWHAER